MGCIIKIGNQSVSETDFLNHLNKIININELFEENPDFSSQIYEALGFKIPLKKGTKEYRDAEDILELEIMLEELGNKKLRGNFKFQDILLKANRTKGFTDKYVGWRKYFNVVTDMDTMIGFHGYVNEKEGYTQSEDTLQQLLQLIKNHVNEFKIEDIILQQKQQAQQLYSQYLEQNPNGSIEQFKSWVGEFNRNKSNLEQQSEDKTVDEIYKEKPYLKEFIDSVTDGDNDISIYKVKNILDKHGEGRIVKLNKILYNAINRLWDNNVFAQNNIKIKFVDSLPENAVGNFNRDNNEITVDKRKFLNNVIDSDKDYPIFYLGYILNHEIIHYLTPKDLSLKIEYVDRALNGKFGDTFRLEHEREFGKNIKELYDVAIEKLDNIEDYGFLDLAEFVAEAMSNPSFQEKLASIPYKTSKQSLWKRFIKILSAYLTKHTGKPINDTLLEAVLVEITNYITENSNIQKTYKRRNVGKNEYIDLNYNFEFNTVENVNSLSDFITQKSQEKLNAIQEIFNSNPELSKIGTVEQYTSYLDTIFPDSKVVEMDNSLYNSVLNQLEQENIIEKDCTGGGKLKAEKGLQTNFTKGSEWEIYEIFEGKSHKQGGIDINIKNNQISFTNKNGSIKAKYGLVISKDN